MTASKPRVYYFRSLNTRGDDSIKVGPFLLGSFSSRFERVLDPERLDFVPVLGLGTGPLQEQAERGKKFLENDGFFERSGGAVHFFGHSAGGLVAKLILEDARFSAGGWVRSLITIGTPHHLGAASAWAAEFSLRRPLGARFFRQIFGYDFQKKRATFESFRAVAERMPAGTEAETRVGLEVEAMAGAGAGRDQAADPEIEETQAKIKTRTRLFSFPASLFTGSVICAPPPRTWSVLMRTLRHFLPLSQVPLPSDGLIERDAQVFGENHWEFQLDHIQQIGFGGQGAEFLRLCRFLESLWAEL
jgi:hypothetical protein